MALNSDLQPDMNLFIVSATGGAPVPLVTNDNSWERRPAWSPDGALIAYVRDDAIDCLANCGLWVTAPDGTGNRRVVPGALTDQPITWTRDSREILVARQGFGGPNVRGLVDAQTGSFRQLDVSGSLVARPLSSDGRYLLLTSRTAVNEPAVVVVGADGSGRKQVHSDAIMGMHPVWRP